MTKNKYGFRVVWSDEDNAYVAICPELPGVVALGDSEGEALREAKVAMELYIEDVLESGEQLPEPQTAQEYSGQTRLRIAKSLHRLAAEMAEAQGISLNRFIESAIEAKIAGEQVGARFIAEMKRVLMEQARQNQMALASLIDQQGTDRAVETEIHIRTTDKSTAYAKFGRGN